MRNSAGDATTACVWQQNVSATAPSGLTCQCSLGLCLRKNSFSSLFTMCPPRVIRRSTRFMRVQSIWQGLVQSGVGVLLRFSATMRKLAETCCRMNGMACSVMCNCPITISVRPCGSTRQSCSFSGVLCQSDMFLSLITLASGRLFALNL